MKEKTKRNPETAATQGSLGHGWFILRDLVSAQIQLSLSIPRKTVSEWYWMKFAFWKISSEKGQTGCPVMEGRSRDWVLLGCTSTMYSTAWLTYTTCLMSPTALRLMLWPPFYRRGKTGLREVKQLAQAYQSRERESLDQNWHNTKELGRNQEQTLFTLEWSELEYPKFICGGGTETSCYGLKQPDCTPSEVKESQIRDICEIYSTLIYE